MNGIYADNKGNFRTAYPKNYIPIAGDTGLSKGYLKIGYGLQEFGTGPGIDRGSKYWNSTCYRVMGQRLVQIDANGTTTEVGTIPGSGQVTMVYSFDYLAIAANNGLFLFDGATIQQVTDVDLGAVLSVVWVDGYFMTTDGEFLVVTDLNNPFAVNPLKYGSSEADPDPVKKLLTVRNEVYALNRYTIEVFDNIGGDGFPFQRIEGAQVEKGTIGTHSACVYMESIAFVGSGPNEPPAAYIAMNGNAVKVSTTEIDRILKKYTESDLSNILIESKKDIDMEHLYIHLPDQTLVYDGLSSKKTGQHVWFHLHSSATDTPDRYRARNYVWAYNKWLVGDPQSNRHGYETEDVATHYGQDVSWEFGTGIIYNESVGALVNEIELIGLTGNTANGDNPTISTEYSVDGRSWSQPRRIRAGKIGDTEKRLVWLDQGNMRRWRIQRFRGLSDTNISFAVLQIRLEPLNV